VRQQGSKGEFHPPVVGDEHQEEIASGFQHAGSFGEWLPDTFPIEVVDGICADDCIEGSGFEGKLAHVRSLNGDALIDACCLQVREQSLLRALPGPEVLLEGLTE
jgi:hypothetical protein